MILACSGSPKTFPPAEPAPIIGATNSGPTPIYVIAGQSNASGNGFLSQMTAEEQVTPSDARIYCAGPIGASEDATLLGRWTPLIAGDGVDLTFAGPELGFAQNMTGPVFVIKFTACGTSMDTFWRSPSAGGAFPGYVGLLNSIKAGLACANIPGGAHIAGLLWLQGESDAPDQEAAANYGDRLAAFINDFRHAMSEPELPVVVAQIHSLPTYAFGAEVQAAQASMATTLPNVATFTTMDIPVPSNTNPHFGGPEQIEIGQRFATSIRDLAGDY